MSIVRKQFVFILNQAVDMSNSSRIRGEQMYFFSNEVNSFKKWLEKQDIDDELKKQLQIIGFYYPPVRGNLLDNTAVIVPLMICSAGTFWIIRKIIQKIQTEHRKELLSNFITKYDKLLILLD